MWIRVLEIPLLSQLTCDVNILENCLDLRAEEKELTKSGLEHKQCMKLV